MLGPMVLRCEASSSRFSWVIDNRWPMHCSTAFIKSVVAVKTMLIALLFCLGSWRFPKLGIPLPASLSSTGYVNSHARIGAGYGEVSHQGESKNMPTLYEGCMIAELK